MGAAMQSCPRCRANAGEQIVEGRAWSGDALRRRYAVVCRNCGVRTGPNFSRGRTLKHWQSGAVQTPEDATRRKPEGGSESEMASAVGREDSPRINPPTAAGRFFFATLAPVGSSTGVFVGGPIETQMRQALSNLALLLEEAGGSLADVVQMIVCLIDVKDVVGMNKIYREFFTNDPYPTRATLIVHQIVGPAGTRVEVTAQAYLGAGLGRGGAKSFA